MAIENAVNWRKELDDLVAAAATDDDREATEAFAMAIGPYLDDPSLLKTLLGKIQRRAAESVTVVAAQHEFESLDQIQEKVGDDVNVIEL